MIILQPDLELNKFGLHARLVSEEDADFIVKLRTSPKVANFLHYTSNSVEEQKEWIRNYKLREKEGKEFYFVFSKDGIKKGVFRLYNISDNSFTGGSWTFDEKSSMEDSIAGVIISLDVAFYQLHMDVDDLFDGVHENNKKVLKFNKMLGVEFSATRETKDGLFYIGRLTKESYEKNRKRMLKIIGY